MTILLAMATGGAVVTLMILWKPSIGVMASLVFYLAASAQTPSVVAGGLGILAALTLASALTKYEQPRIRPGLAAALIVLASFAVCQVLYYQGGNEVAARYAALAAALLLGLAVFQIALDERREAALVAGIAGIAVLEALIGFAQFAQHRVVIPNSMLGSQAASAALGIPGQYRAFGTLGHPNAYGILLVLIVPLMIGQARRVSGVRSLAWALSGLVILGASVLSLSRSVVVALVGAAAYWFLINRTNRSARAFWVLGLMVLTILFVTKRGLGRLGVQSGVVQRDESSNLARLTNMQAALEAWLDAPYAGHGLGSGSAVGRVYGGYADLGAHNSYLDLLAGGGVVLFVLMLVLFAPVVRAGHRIAQGGDITGTTMLLALILGLFESLIQSGLVVFLALLAGICVARERRDRLPNLSNEEVLGEHAVVRTRSL